MTRLLAAAIGVARRARERHAATRWQRGLNHDLLSCDGATDEEFEAVIERWEALRPAVGR